MSLFCSQFKICISALLFISLFVTAISAEQLPQRVVEQAGVVNDQLIRDQQETVKALLPESTPQKSITPQSQSLSKIAAGGPCFHIHQTQLIDESSLLPIDTGYQKLNDTCADKKALVELVESLNIYYQKLGLITTRVYLQAQNLKSGLLVLVAKAGVLDRFKLVDDSKAPMKVSAAYPFGEGDLIQLRDMEQGLDNLNRLQSQSAKTELQPGSELGLSELVVTIKNSKPWSVNLGLNNQGVESTGKNKATLGLGFDNVLNLNDDLYFSLNQNINHSSAQKYSRSLSLSYNIPYKNWLFKFSSSDYGYERIISGINQTFKIDGFSRNNRFAIDYLLYRNQQSRVYATSSLNLKKTRNYIEDIEISSQYRRLTLLELGLRGDHQFANRNFMQWSVNATRNLHAFTDMHVIPGLADDDFSYLRGDIKLDVPLPTLGAKYRAELAFQYSKNELTGSEQFSAGGVNSVRGFHQDSLYGNSGLYLRNTLEMKEREKDKWTFKPYLSIDAGFVASPDTIDWSSHVVAGVGAGFSATYDKKLTFKVDVARAIRRPNELTARRNQAFFSINYAF